MLCFDQARIRQLRDIVYHHLTTDLSTPLRVPQSRFRVVGVAPDRGDPIRPDCAWFIVDAWPDAVDLARGTTMLGRIATSRKKQQATLASSAASLSSTASPSLDAFEQELDQNLATAAALLARFAHKFVPQEQATFAPVVASAAAMDANTSLITTSSTASASLPTAAAAASPTSTAAVASSSSSSSSAAVAAPVSSQSKSSALASKYLSRRAMIVKSTAQSLDTLSSLAQSAERTPVASWGSPIALGPATASSMGNTPSDDLSANGSGARAAALPITGPGVLSWPVQPTPADLVRTLETHVSDLQQTGKVTVLLLNMHVCPDVASESKAIATSVMSTVWGKVSRQLNYSAEHRRELVR